MVQTKHPTPRHDPLAGIVGVTERGFHGLAVGYPARVFIPFGNFAGGLQSYFPPPDLMAMSVVARLPIATTPDAARALVRARWPQWLQAFASALRR